MQTRKALSLGPTQVCYFEGPSSNNREKTSAVFDVFEELSDSPQWKHIYQVLLCNGGYWRKTEGSGKFTRMFSHHRGSVGCFLFSLLACHWAKKSEILFNCATCWQRSRISFFFQQKAKISKDLFSLSLFPWKTTTHRAGVVEISALFFNETNFCFPQFQQWDYITFLLWHVTYTEMCIKCICMV